MQVVAGTLVPLVAIEPRTKRPRNVGGFLLRQEYGDLSGISALADVDPHGGTLAPLWRHLGSLAHAKVTDAVPR
jgi:hypothetical protein